MPVRQLLLLVAAASAAACQSRNFDPIHAHGPAEVQGLEREGREGPYLAGATETFRAVVDEEAVATIRWSASDGALNASGARASWKLPSPGVATLTATVVTRTGEERTASWDFQIIEGGAGTSRESLLTAPIAVLDGGVTSGSFCDVSYDPVNSSHVHLAFREDSHPSLWYALWNGSSWNLQHVDGMGFNTGGQVESRFAMVIDPSGNPHFAYALAGRGIWYATKSGTTWVRERVDSTVAPNASSVSLALNPAQSNRPTIAYGTENSSGYSRVAIASRTSPGTWTQTTVSFTSTTYDQRLAGDILIDSGGTVYVPYTHYNASYAYLGTWNGTAAAHLGLNPTSSNTGFDAVWANSAWAGAGKLLLRTKNAVYEVTTANPISSGSFTLSSVELTGSTVGDVAYANGKPYLLHLHGSNLELVTTAAGSYWAYTQLGSATTYTVPSLTVNASGAASICYQSNGKIYFQ